MLFEIPTAVTAISPILEIINVSVNPTMVCKIFSTVAGMAKFSICLEFLI